VNNRWGWGRCESVEAALKRRDIQELFQVTFAQPPFEDQRDGTRRDSVEHAMGDECSKGILSINWTDEARESRKIDVPAASENGEDFLIPGPRWVGGGDR